jgi:hypothetical protein
MYCSKNKKKPFPAFCAGLLAFLKLILRKTSDDRLAQQ